LPPRVKKKKRRAEGKPLAKEKPPAEAAAQEPPAQAAVQAEREQEAAAVLRRAARAARAAARTAQPELPRITSSWEIVARDKAVIKEETVVVSVYTYVTAWTGEAVDFTVDTPAPLQSVTSDILQALRESESELPVTMLVAIGVVAAAVVVVTSFLLITFVKFKNLSATSKNSGFSEVAVA
jgi:hypothetical protein